MIAADTLTNSLLLYSDAYLTDFHNNLPVNSLKVIGWVPCGVEKHNHIGSYKVKAKATCPEIIKRRKSIQYLFFIIFNLSCLAVATGSNGYGCPCNA